MQAGVLFWVLMVVWFCLGAYRSRAEFGLGAGGDLLLFLVVGLLGWRVFGPILQ